VWLLAEIFQPPGDSLETARSVRVAPGGQGGSAKHNVRSRGLLECVCLVVEVFRQAVPIALSGSKALGGTRPPPGGLEVSSA